MCRKDVFRRNRKKAPLLLFWVVIYGRASVCRFLGSVTRALDLLDLLCCVATQWLDPQKSGSENGDVDYNPNGVTKIIWKFVRQSWEVLEIENLELVGHFDGLGSLVLTPNLSQSVE